MTKNLRKPFSVEVEVAGRSYSGTYTIDGNVLNVHWDGWSEKSQAGAAGAEITA